MSQPTSMTALLTQRLAEHPDSRVVDDRDRQRAPADWLDRVPRIAAGLRALGVRRGDHVALWSRNSIGWLELWFATAWLDAVLVPLNTRVSEGEARFVLTRGDVRWLFWEPLNALSDDGVVRRLTPPGCRSFQVQSDDDTPWADLVEHEPVGSQETPGGIGMIQFTSGSTGNPKGVMLRAEAMIRNAQGLARAWQVVPGETVLCANPLFHNGGAVFSHLMSVVAGADLTVMRRWDAGAAVDLVRRHEITVFPTIDTMLRDLLARPEEDQQVLRSLRVASTAGSRVLFEAIREAWDCRPSNVYGMTETSPNVAVGDLADSDEVRLTWVGRPQRGLEVELREPSGATVRDGGTGQIHVRGWAVTPGYYADPEATAAAIGADGFLRTGDLGRMSSDGLLEYAGRLKRMAKSGGENVSLLEVEESLRAFAGIDDVAVVTVPDERYGEALVAFVTGRLGPDDEQAVVAFLRGRIASFKVPRRVLVTDALPRTGTQKVDYVTLGAWARTAQEQVG